MPPPTCMASDWGDGTVRLRCTTVLPVAVAEIVCLRYTALFRVWVMDVVCLRHILHDSYDKMSAEPIEPTINVQYSSWRSTSILVFRRAQSLVSFSEAFLFS
jgi:hypothetical protein